jgi:hypothetical protein
MHLELKQRERFIRAGEVAGASQTFQNRSRFNGLSGLKVRRAAPQGVCGSFNPSAV